MTANQGNKVKTSIALNVYLRDRAKQLVDSKQFASISDVVSTALSEFYGRLDERETSQMKKELVAEVKFSELLDAYLKTEEGNKLLTSLSKTESEKEIIKNMPRKVIFD